MKRIARLLGIAAGIGAVAWLVKDWLLPAPQPPTDEPPSFRYPTPEPAGEAPPATTVGDDLTEIKGIGPAFARRLAEAGISTFAALAEADSADLASRIDVSGRQIDDWIEQARRR